MRKLRAQQVIFDLPKEDSDIWVNVVIQTIVKGDEDPVDQTMDRTGNTHRVIDDNLTETTTIVDPITGDTITASVAGTTALVRQFIMTWMQEDHGGTILEDDIGNYKELIK